MPPAAPVPGTPMSPLESVVVFPPDINLETIRDTQSFVVQARHTDGLTYDVTDQVKTTFVNPALVKLDKNVVAPIADGTTEMRVEFGGKTVSVPVKVKDAKAERPISFRLDTMPIFMRSGCNSGSCHGAARGKDGFRLSLFGFDPDGDHFRITREMNGRRLNLAVPTEGLFMEKACGLVPHTGGERVKPGSEQYQSIVRWHEAGAPNDAPTVATPTNLEFYPKKRRLRRGRLEAARHRAGEILRRHRPRRHQPHALPDE